MKKIISFILAANFLAPLALGGSTTELIDTLCGKISTCAEANPKLRSKVGRKSAACSVNLSGTQGALLWDRFGLVGHEREYKAPDIDAMVTSGELLMSQPNFAQCVEEISTMDCGVVQDHVSKDFTNVEYLISDKGSCPKVYTEVVQPTKTVGQLIDSICSAYANCQEGTPNPILVKETCMAELNGETGKVIWDELGLKKWKNQLTAAEVEKKIEAQDILVDVEALNECRQERIPEIACKKFDKYVTASHWTNIDKALGNKAPCKHTLRIARGVR